jgi:uncharacterized membrane protein
MLSYIVWAVATLLALNLAALVALILAYAWHHGVKPQVARRSARQNAFELLIANTSIENILSRES